MVNVSCVCTFGDNTVLARLRSGDGVVQALSATRPDRVLVRWYAAVRRVPVRGTSF
jgi:hypothetical protein